MNTCQRFLFNPLISERNNNLFKSVQMRVLEIYILYKIHLHCLSRNHSHSSETQFQETVDYFSFLKDNFCLSQVNTPTESNNPRGSVTQCLIFHPKDNQPPPCTSQSLAQRPNLACLQS